MREHERKKVEMRIENDNATFGSKRLFVGAAMHGDITQISRLPDLIGPSYNHSNISN